MSPVFVRRGTVLFLFKNHRDFLKKLHSGRIRQTDALLVRESNQTRWLPIREIHEFQFGEKNSTEPQASYCPSAVDGDPLDHIRRPGFNLEALVLGACWYFRYKMPRLGLRWSLAVLLPLIGLLTLGHFLRFSIWILMLWGCAVWLGSALVIALRADADLNERQIAHFYNLRLTKEPNHSTVPSTQLEGEYPELSTIHPGREKILN